MSLSVSPTVIAEVGASCSAVGMLEAAPDMHGP